MAMMYYARARRIRVALLSSDCIFFALPICVTSTCVSLCISFWVSSNRDTSAPSFLKSHHPWMTCKKLDCHHHLEGQRCLSPRDGASAIGGKEDARHSLTRIEFLYKENKTIKLESVDMGFGSYVILLGH